MKSPWFLRADRFLAPAHVATLLRHPRLRERNTPSSRSKTHDTRSGTETSDQFRMRADLFDGMLRGPFFAGSPH